MEMNGKERKVRQECCGMKKKVLAVPFADCDFDTGTFAESWSVRV